MSHNKQVPEGKDPSLWEIAQKRASFKSHALAYILVNVFLWTIWFISSKQNDYTELDENFFPWPLWTTVGWGIGLAFHFAGAYVFPKSNAVEREYEKLKNNQIN